MEAGSQLQTIPGRPNIRGILKELQCTYSDAPEVHVHVAGADDYALHAIRACGSLKLLCAAWVDCILEYLSISACCLLSATD